MASSSNTPPNFCQFWWPSTGPVCWRRICSRCSILHPRFIAVRTADCQSSTHYHPSIFCSFLQLERVGQQLLGGGFPLARPASSHNQPSATAATPSAADQFEPNAGRLPPVPVPEEG